MSKYNATYYRREMNMKELPRVRWGENVLDVFKFAVEFFKDNPDEEWVKGELDNRPIYFKNDGTHTFEQPDS